MLSRLILLLALLAAAGGCAVDVDDATRIERAEAAVESGDVRTAAIELRNVLRSDPSNVRARTLLGRVALVAGDPGTAIKELRKASELGAEPDDYLVSLARALRAVGRLDELKELESDELSNDGDRADLHALIGDAYLRSGDVGAARRRYELALSRQPRHPDALIGMASIRFNAGDTAGAEADLRSVVEQRPDMHAPHAALARLKLIQADYPAAEQSFAVALERAKNEPDAKMERAIYMIGMIDALLAQKKSGNAQDMAAQLLAIAPQQPLALFQAARADFEAGEFDAVIEKTQRVLSIVPNNQKATLLLAAAAMAKQEFGLAAMHLDELVERHPGDAQARKLLAQTRMSMGSPEDALEALAPLLDEHGDDPALMAMAGSASIRSGDTQAGMEMLARGAAGGSEEVQLAAAANMLGAGRAAEALETLESIPPEQASDRREVLTIMALIQQGKVSMARERAEAVLESRPGDADAYRVTGGFYLATGQFDAAREQFEQGLALDSANQTLILNLAQLEARQGNTAAAQRRFSELLELDPGSLIALLGLAGLAELQGDTDRAVALIEQARSDNPGVAQPPLLLSRYYLRSGDNEKALQRATEAFEAAPNNPDTLVTLGQARIENDRYSEALGNLERAVQIAPKSVEARYQLARAQLKLQMSETAIASMRETLELDPDHLGANVAVSRADGLRGDYEKALGSAARLRNRYPQRAEPFVLEGDIYMMRGDVDAAIDAYDRAGALAPVAAITRKRFDARRRAGRADSHVILEEYLEGNPGDIATRVVLAGNYEANGLTDKAIAEYRRVLEQDADNVVALNNLAWVYAGAGDDDKLKQGLELAKRAYDIAPDDGAVLDTYAWLKLRTGDVNEAERLLREALRIAPDSPDIRYHLAVALHRGGEAREARRLLDRLLTGSEDFAGSEEAQRLREELGEE